MAWIKWLGLLLGVLVVVAAGLNAYGAWHWARNTRSLMSRLDAAREAPAPTRYDAGELEGWGLAA